jgi:hypothetical protein
VPPVRTRRPRGLPPLWITTLIAFLVLPFTTGPCGPVSGSEYVGKAVSSDPRASGAGWWVVCVAVCIAAGTVVAFLRSRWARVACAALSSAALGGIVGFSSTFRWGTHAQESLGIGADLTVILLLVLGAVNAVRASEGRATDPGRQDQPEGTVAERFTMTS